MTGHTDIVTNELYQLRAEYERKNRDIAYLPIDCRYVRRLKLEKEFEPQIQLIERILTKLNALDD